MKSLKNLSFAAAIFASISTVNAATTIFQIDFQSTDVDSVETQAGWTAWTVAQNATAATLNNTVGGIGVTLTALGTGAKFEGRGGNAASRGGEITGTSWNDVVEDLIAARNGTGTGAGDMSIALTGLSVGNIYTLTGWHNESYTINAGFSADTGYAVTPSITLGTLVGTADAGASTNRTAGARTDALFNTSVISFTPDGSGNATILLDGASTSNFLALNGLQLTVPEPSAAFLGSLGVLALLRRRRN